MSLTFVTVLYTSLQLTTMDSMVLFTKVVKIVIYTYLTMNCVMGCFFGKMIGNLISLARPSDRQSVVLGYRMSASNNGVRGNR